MQALSIRQPYAEMILRGTKKYEFRSVATKNIGKRFYIYAPKKTADPPAIFTQMPNGPVRAKRGRWGRGYGQTPKLQRELWGEGLDAMPKGVIVGSAVIVECTPVTDGYRWELDEVKRLKRPKAPAKKPQPVWFTPF